jgi:hypothetical protein
MLDGWSVAELKRQKDTGLFMRLALSKNKEEILKLAQHGQIALTPKDIVKDVDVCIVMYMGYFAKEENREDENPPIGIIMSKDKDDLLVEYATYEMNSQLFVSKYQLYLPDKEELRNMISRQLENGI